MIQINRVLPSSIVNKFVSFMSLVLKELTKKKTFHVRQEEDGGEKRQNGIKQRLTIPHAHHSAIKASASTLPFVTHFAVPLLSVSYQHYKEPYKPCVCFGPLQTKKNTVVFYNWLNLFLKDFFFFDKLLWYGFQKESQASLIIQQSYAECETCCYCLTCTLECTNSFIFQLLNATKRILCFRHLTTKCKIFLKNVCIEKIHFILYTHFYLCKYSGELINKGKKTRQDFYV